jgi:hypothetical protein
MMEKLAQAGEDLHHYIIYKVAVYTPAERQILSPI